MLCSLGQNLFQRQGLVVAVEGGAVGVSGQSVEPLMRALAVAAERARVEALVVDEVVVEEVVDDDA